MTFLVSRSDLEALIFDVDGTLADTEELHRQAEYLRGVESKNARLTGEMNVLRAKEASVEVLREEKRGLERKIRVMEELRERVVKLEAEVEAGRREREAWLDRKSVV